MKVTPVKYAFGMSHTFGDYNQDGLLDFYAIGMSSTTARRLEYMNLRRNDFEDRTKARPNMGYGNRMYLSKGGAFEQHPRNDQVARSGWSWGSTTFDPDNDGDHDLFIANGYQSGKSCKDYCTRYWTARHLHRHLEARPGDQRAIRAIAGRARQGRGVVERLRARRVVHELRRQGVSERGLPAGRGV